MEGEFLDRVYTVEDTLKLLFQKQASRCHEYVLYRLSIQKKYETMNFGGEPNVAKFEHSSIFINGEKFKKNLDTTTLTDQEKLQLLAKHRRMKDAKRLFERLNGDYKNYQ